MPKILKIAFMVTLLPIVLVVGLAIFLLATISPNDYKPQLEQAAQQQGIDLNLEGDIGWSLFPDLAIELNDIGFASDSYNVQPSMLKSARLKVALLPLLHKQLVVDALEVNGADINLEQADPTSVVAAPLAATQLTQDQLTSATPTGTAFSLAINELSLKQSRVTLHNPDATTTIDNINLDSQKVNSQGASFPLKLSFQYPLNEAVAQITVDGDFSYTEQTNSLTTTELSVEITDLLKQPVAIKLSGTLNTADSSADISKITGLLDGIALEGNLAISGFDSSPTYFGKLQVASSNLKGSLATLLEGPVTTRNPEALKQLDLQIAFKGTDQHLDLQTFQLNLDSTSISGAGALQLDPIAMKLKLSGNHINIDDYQSPETEQSSPNADADADASNTDEALLAPLAGIISLLAGGKGTVELQFESIVIAGTPLSRPDAKLLIEGNKLQLSPLRTGVYEGQASADINVDMASPEPQINFKLALAGVDIGQGQQQWAKDTSLAGTLTMNAGGSTHGESSEALLNNLSATGNLAIRELHLASVNIEQSYCELAQLVEKNPPRESPWPAGTDLNPLASQFSIASQTISLTNYITGVGNLKVRGQGVIDLQQQRFNMDVITNLQGERTSETGCAIKSKRIRNRDIPLKCKDSFAKAGATSCRPDQDFVKSMLQKELLDKLIKPGDDGEEKPIESLLKGLFNR